MAEVGGLVSGQLLRAGAAARGALMWPKFKGQCLGTSAGAVPVVWMVLAVMCVLAGFRFPA